MKAKLTARISEIILGIFFVISSIGKWMDPMGFERLIESYGFPQLVFLAPILTGLEMTLGVLLLVGLKKQWVFTVSGSLLVVFTIAFGYGYLVNGVDDCGCFGAIETLKMSPLASFIRNFILIALSYIGFSKAEFSKDYTLWKWVSSSAVGVLVMAIFYMGGLPGMSQSKKPVLAETTVQQNFPVKGELAKLAIPNLVKLHPDSTYMVIVLGYGCGHCWRHTPKAADYLAEGVVDRVVGLGYQPNGSNYKPEFYKRVPNWNYEMIDVEYYVASTLARTLPTTYFIKNNEIVVKEQGVIEKVDSFKELHPDF